MLFNSFIFLGLLIITFILYYLPALSKYQIQILILSSFVFYSYHSPFQLLVLLLSLSINIITSYYVVYGKNESKKMIALLGVLLNLLMLIFFRYSSIFAQSFLNINNSIGQFFLTIPIPLGISFSTFQGISLVIDVFNRNPNESKKLIPVSFKVHLKQIIFFKSFFPQLMAGPIVRVTDIIPQIAIKKIKDIPWELCFKNLVTGYFLKMVVADNLKNFTYWISYPYFQYHKSGTLLFMLFGYSCEIFADFAGYSLIAIGIAKLFGFHFKDNFNFPYISTSFKEFWTRWHISLSTWLRDYLFMPIANFTSNKMIKDKYLFIKTEHWIYFISTFITFFICGIWHGVGWGFVIWGSFYGIALIVEKIFNDRFKRKKKFKIPKIVNGFIVFGFVTLAWIFFKLPELSYVVEYFTTIFTKKGIGDKTIIKYIMLYSLPVIIYHLLYLFKKNNNYKYFNKIEFIVYGLMIFLIITNSSSSGSFIYFQF